MGLYFSSLANNGLGKLPLPFRLRRFVGVREDPEPEHLVEIAALFGGEAVQSFGGERDVVLQHGVLVSLHLL